MKSLAIERQYGSGGREIGILTAKLLGIPYYDEEILLKTAEKQGANIEILKDYDEKKVGSLLYNIAMLSDFKQYENQTKTYEMYHKISDTIIKTALEGPAVFIGRCSTEILKKDSYAKSVFVYASDESHRVNRIVRKENIGADEAKKLIQRVDKERENYFSFYTHKSWTDRNNYDLEVNTTSSSIQECAELFAVYMKY